MTHDLAKELTTSTEDGLYCYPIMWPLSFEIYNNVPYDNIMCQHMSYVSF